MLCIRKCLAVGHIAFGLVLLLGVMSFIVLGIHGLPQLLMNAPRTHMTSTLLIGVTAILLPEMALGIWMLILARWLWSGYLRLNTMLRVTHGFLLLLSMLVIKCGFDAIEAAEHSTAQGGGLLSPFAFFPFLIGVPLLVFALCSIAVAFWAVPQRQAEV